MRVCNRCVMNDYSDETIVFDEKGICNYCSDALAAKETVYFPNDIGKEKLKQMIDVLKKNGKRKDYDCLMGISGGLDSSYLAYLGHTWGLRILAVHIDDGYDTDISKKNIKKLCDAAGITLKTIIPDRKQYDALLLAYMKAGVPNLAAPQDNILLAFLYNTALDSGIKYFLSGGNFALECILQRGNTHKFVDVANIKDINKKFGVGEIDKLRFISQYKKYWYQKSGKIITVRPLDFLEYNRNRAFQELQEFCGFEYYGRKHLENILTAFLQLYWLPKKFGVDKRTSHLSSMIVSGQMTREQALNELDEPMYDEKTMEKYIEIIKKRLGLSDKEFQEIMEAQSHRHEDYKCDELDPVLRKILRLLK